MKTIVRLFLVGGFLLGSAGALMAATGSQTYTMSATVPSPTSVSITASSVNSSNNQFTSVSGTALSFDPLTFDTTNNIYIPNHYFAIDVGPAGGAGSTSATVSYTEGTNPNSASGGSGHGLGYKTVATFAKEAGSTETIMSSHPKEKLIDISSPVTISTSDTSGGTLRLYLGLETNPTAAGEPAGAEVFSAADKTGAYTGSVVISATVA